MLLLTLLLIPPEKFSVQITGEDSDGEVDEWVQRLASTEVEEVRIELIEKYLELGRTQEFAENEVDNFLNDRERSEKFLDMRRIAKEAEIVLNVISKYWAAFSAAYPQAGFGDFLKQFFNL
ncbi:hypothetical protein TrRE_jg6885 [Triparma retinervis]|uniref:Uncharacterized protein n=1 Tax=Triparma retinervis TaxID=2557542 RepID=A0A9W6ZRW4_9STRA|nr:hypothetical protein TrRE_jg6885 [Triparma retinervis]